MCIMLTVDNTGIQGWEVGTHFPLWIQDSFWPIASCWAGVIEPIHGIPACGLSQASCIMVVFCLHGTQTA